MAVILTTPSGPWFAARHSDGSIGLFTNTGYEVPSVQERKALRRILTGGSDGD